MPTPFPVSDNSLTTLLNWFGPVFKEIAQGAAKRDAERILPAHEVSLLRKAGFTRLRIPVEYGGAGVDLPTLFALIEELALADSNLAQIFRGHFGYCEILVTAAPSDWRNKWQRRLGQGEIIAPAFSETGEASLGKFSTHIRETAQGRLLDGEKFYTTGALYADWLDVSAELALREGEETSFLLAQISTSAAGVEILDDWNGFGQRVTASGTTRFNAVAVNDEDVRDFSLRTPTLTAYYQLYHLATLAGIGRAAALAFAGIVAKRRRSFSHAAAARAADDPQVLQQIGRVRAKASSASRLARDGAQRLQLATEFLQRGDGPDIAALEIEIYEAQVVIARLVLEAASEGFDALGASSTSRDLNIDRFWRNARTLANHNPLIYKERQIGDYAVNGTAPAGFWRAGVASTSG